MGDIPMFEGEGYAKYHENERVVRRLSFMSEMNGCWLGFSVHSVTSSP
jgi:hypothetical protein